MCIFCWFKFGLIWMSSDMVSLIYVIFVAFLLFLIYCSVSSERVPNFAILQIEQNFIYNFLCNQTIWKKIQMHMWVSFICLSCLFALCIRINVFHGFAPNYLFKMVMDACEIQMPGCLCLIICPSLCTYVQWCMVVCVCVWALETNMDGIFGI